jgi:MFS family permease
MPASTPVEPERPPAARQRLTPQQWKSGIAAWLGWLFDGLDMHIYTLVGVAFVAVLVERDNFRDTFAQVTRGADGIRVEQWPAHAAADADRNGRVSAEELARFAQGDGAAFLRAITPESDPLLPKLDSDKDGVLSTAEWPSFEATDQNRDGAMSRDEWEVFAANFHTADTPVKDRSSWIQAAFLIGWALGGAFFGRLGDLLGRSRALSLTVLTYALFTGLSFFAQNWWHLLIFRFLAALGIGGEWAVGSTLLAETWPRAWRPWTAAVLQTGVNLGVIIGVVANNILAGQHPRWIFLIGVLPAVLVFYIRRHVPEPETWTAAHAHATRPGVGDLFRGATRRITLVSIGICACSLTGWWAFMYWQAQHVRALPEVVQMTASARNTLVGTTFGWIIGISIVGNFVAGLLARLLGYKAALLLMFGGFIVTMCATFGRPHSLHALTDFWLPAVGFWSGVFGLFTMMLPPLFPTLLRTTGAGFCYNIGRIAAAVGTIFAAQITQGGNFQRTLYYVGFLFIPAMIFTLMLPAPREAEE